MTISPEYAAELGRQVDELEAENERLRSIIPTEPQKSAVISAADWERMFQDACDEAGCEYDNEALLSSIANLTSYVDMLWAWFRERRGSEDMRANVANGGLSADDFKQMLDDHEASLIPTEPQESPVSEFERDGIARCLFDKAMSGLAQWDEMTEPNKEDWRLLADDWILETTRRIEMGKGFRVSPLPREASSPHPSQQGNCK